MAAKLVAVGEGRNPVQDQGKRKSLKVHSVFVKIALTTEAKGSIGHRE